MPPPQRLFILLMLVAGAGLARAQEVPLPPQAPGLKPEPAIFGQAVEYAGEKLAPTPGEVPKDGVYPEFGYMITGSGWISAGPGYRHKFADSRGLFDSSAAISWRAYKIAQARVEFHAIGKDLLTIGGQGFYQDTTQIHFFGQGPDSSKAQSGSYRLRATDAIGWARLNLAPFVISGTVGYLSEPTISSAAGPFKAGYTDARALFGNIGAPGILDPAGFLHGNLSVAIDNRDAPEHPTRGGMYRGGWSTYSDRDTGQYSFQRYEAEAVQIVPLGSTNWLLAMHGWLVGSDSDEGKMVPVYMLPSLGGHDTLRGYTDYRFHDRDLLLASVESRWAVWEHLDLALFVDAGNVAPKVRDLDLSKTSIGVGARVHTHSATLGRLDLAHSKEGWRLVFKMDDPFALSRLSRRLAMVPFVP